MDITLEISRLQADYGTAMKWAEISKDDSELQANYYLAAASAQNQLYKLVPDQAMKARYAKERDRLVALASSLKGIAIPVASVVPSKAEKDQKSTENKTISAPPTVSVLAEKNKPGKIIKTIYSDIDLSSARYTDPEVMKMSLSDMDGIEAEKEKVMNFFKHREEKKQYQKLDEAAKAIKSIEPKINMLVYGPAGTGKSSFLSAIGKYVLETQEDSVFFMLEPDMFRDKWRGQSEKVIKETFYEARQFQTALICIDEISALCPKNKENLQDADRATLNTFLIEADGVKRTEGSDVILIAGTNYPWDIDTAALSRLSERLYFGLPSKEARKKFFLGHASSYLGNNPEDQEKFADYLADRMDHAGYRELNHAAGLLYALCWHETLKANPENKEIDTFIPATTEQLDQIINGIVIPYNETYIHRLENPELW